MDYAALAKKIRRAIFDDAESRGRVLQDSMDAVIERELRAAVLMEASCSPQMSFAAVGCPLNPETSAPLQHSHNDLVTVASKKKDVAVYLDGAGNVVYACDDGTPILIFPAGLIEAVKSSKT